MHPRWNAPSFLMAIHVAAAVLLANAVHAQQLPRSVTIGSNPPGSAFYSVASGLSKVVTEAAPFQMAVQPHSGSSTFLPLLNSGEMDFGVVNAVGASLSYPAPARLHASRPRP